MPYEGQTGTAPDGTRVIWRNGRAVPIAGASNVGGDVARAQAAKGVGPKPRPDWGPGAAELPNGSIVRYGARGGMDVLQAAGEKAGTVKLTEDQGKNAGFSRLMQTAEDQYQSARRGGYNPGSLRNGFAQWIEENGRFLAGVAPVIRDDASDRGKAAERLFNEAQMKAMTGAGQSKGEEVNTPRIYFPRFGEAAAVEAQKAAARREAIEASRMRAGPAAPAPRPSLIGGARAPAGERRLSPAEAAKLPPGTPFIGQDGVRRVRQ